MESVLNTIKKMLGITADYEHFDTDIMVHINSVRMSLNQIGVNSTGPVTGAFDTWEEIFGDTTDIEAVKTYIYLKVKMLFDPPANSTVLEAMKQSAAEYEWRLSVK